MEMLALHGTKNRRLRLNRLWRRSSCRRGPWTILIRHC